MQVRIDMEGGAVHVRSVVASDAVVATYEWRYRIAVGDSIQSPQADVAALGGGFYLVGPPNTMGLRRSAERGEE